MNPEQAKTKTCSFCKKNKPVGKFKKSPKSNDGYMTVCMPCNKKRAEINLRWRRKHPDHYKRIYTQYHKQYQTSKPVMANAIMLLSSARKNKKVPCDIDTKYICEKLSEGVCERTGLKFVLSKGKRNPYSPSLDRIVPALGYVKGNVRLVLWAFNAFKNAFSDKEVYPIAKAFYLKYESKHSIK